MASESVHILVVDDHGDLRDLLCLHIAELGCRCEAVARGDDALSVLDWWKPVILIIEPSLRDGSGTGISRKIRAWATEQFRPLFIIVYSNHPCSPQIDTDETYDLYIHKPGDLNEIERAITKFLPPQ